MLGVALLGACAGEPAAAAGAGTETSSTLRAPVRGIVRPLRQAAIATDLAARVATIRFREAEAFRAGDVLATFDCERLEAAQAAAEAVYREMKLALDSNLHLDKRGAVGKLDVDVSKARADKARSKAAALEARLRQCVVTAPFDGRVAELTINEHEIPATGKPFISLVEESAFEIDLIVPSHWLRRIGPDTPFVFTVDESGHSYVARILRTGATVDPVGQSVKLIAAVAGHDGTVLAGMSGGAVFALAEPSR